MTLPGATDVQDIGLAVTAHSASARTSEVEFTDFVLEDGLPGGEPEPEDPPVCLMTGSDAVRRRRADAGRWTTVRSADDLPVSVADGGLVLPVTNGDINEAAAGPISHVGQPTRDGEWTVETAVSLAHTREWQHAGLLMHGSDDDYVKLAFTRTNSGGRMLEFQTEAAGTRTWHANVTLPADFPSTAHLRLASDGEQVTASYSADGSSWTALDGSAQLIDGSTIGLVAAGDTAAHEVDAVFDHFTITPDIEDTGDDVEMSDEFDGAAIDGCRWDSVVRYDSTAAGVADGQLRIQTQPGDINGAANENPRNFILQEVPQAVSQGEDWTIETRLTPTMLHQWQLAGLIVYGDDDNYVKFDVVANNTAGAATNLRAELVSEKGGQFGNGGNRNIDIPETSESGWFYLRLTRSGDTYSAEISDGGVNWTSLGDPVTNDAELTSFGLMAIGPQQTQPVTVAFDYFRVTTEQPDTTPPVITVAGVADGGGYDLATGLELSATATDDVSAEVAVSLTLDGAAVENPSTVTPELGAHTLVATAVDGAGNAAETTVAFEVVATFDGAKALVQRYRTEGAVNRNQGVQLSTHLSNAERLAQQGTSGAATSLDRYVAVAEEVTDETARGWLLAYADALRAQL